MSRGSDLSLDVVLGEGGQLEGVKPRKPGVQPLRGHPALFAAGEKLDKVHNLSHTCRGKLLQPLEQ